MSKFLPFPMEFWLFNHAPFLGMCILFPALFVLCYLHREVSKNILCIFLKCTRASFLVFFNNLNM